MNRHYIIKAYDEEESEVVKYREWVAGKDLAAAACNRIARSIPSNWFVQATAGQDVLTTIKGKL